MDEFLTKTKDVGDFVYDRNQHMGGKLDIRWRPYYVVVEKTLPVSYRIRDQLINSVTKAHAGHCRSASIKKWEIPTIKRHLWKILLAAPVDFSDSDSESRAEQADLSQCASVDISVRTQTMILISD